MLKVLIIINDKKVYFFKYMYMDTDLHTEMNKLLIKENAKNKSYNN